MRSGRPEVGIDIQIHRKVNYDRMLRRMVTEKEREEILKRQDLESGIFQAVGNT